LLYQLSYLAFFAGKSLGGLFEIYSREFGFSLVP